MYLDASFSSPMGPGDQNSGTCAYKASNRLTYLLMSFEVFQMTTCLFLFVAFGVLCCILSAVDVESKGPVLSSEVMSWDFGQFT